MAYTPAENRQLEIQARRLGINAHDYRARQGEYFSEPSPRAHLVVLLGRQPSHTERNRWIQLRSILGGETPTLEQFRAYMVSLRDA